jgi:hypothetical protein
MRQVTKYEVLVYILFAVHFTTLSLRFKNWSLYNRLNFKGKAHGLIQVLLQNLPVATA